MRLYFVRHGQSEANRLHQFSNHGWKHPLTPLGHEQAADTAMRLSGCGVSYIYTSPLMRAVQTACVLAAQLRAPYEIDRRLIEFDCGEWEGSAAEQGWQAYDDLLTAWLVKGQHQQCLPGGETLQQITTRLQAFLAACRAQWPDPEITLAVVGHGGIYRCALPLLCSNLQPTYGLQHPVPHLAVIELLPHGQQWVCRNWCGTPCQF